MSLENKISQKGAVSEECLCHEKTVLCNEYKGGCILTIILEGGG